MKDAATGVIKLTDEQTASLGEALRQWAQGGYKDGLQLLPDGSVAGTCSKEEIKFFAALTKMATWALAHPSKSLFEYVSPMRIKANPNLVTAFMYHYHTDIHPYITDRLRAAMDDSISHGLFPAAVIEHTPDGHHPFGWSWGSEFYIADFYLCLIRAIIQGREMAEKCGIDLTKPVEIAYLAFKLNRVNPTPEIIKAMYDRLDEPDETRAYSVYSSAKGN